LAIDSLTSGGEFTLAKLYTERTAVSLWKSGGARHDMIAPSALPFVLMSLTRQIAPVWLATLWDWRRRLKHCGLSPGQSWKGAFSRELQQDLLRSRVEYLPRELRADLRTVVDVGASDGLWLASLCRFCNIAHAEAFEPNPDIFRRLQVRFERDPRIHLHQAAVGRRPGTLTLQVMGSAEFSSFLVVRSLVEKQYGGNAARLEQEVPVDVTTLDAALNPATGIDLLKVDVQGFEREVFSGACATLRRTRAVLVEVNFKSHYEGDETFGSMYELLTKDHGLVFWDMSPPFRGRDGSALWADAVFLSRNRERGDVESSLT